MSSDELNEQNEPSAPVSVDKLSTPDAGKGGVGDAPIPFFRTNRGIALGLVAIACVLGAYIWSSDWAHREVRDGFPLGGFPLFAVALMIVALLLMAIDTKARLSTPELEAFRLAEAGIAVALLVAIGGMFLLISVLGFAVVVFLIVFLGALLLGYRPVWIAFATAVVAAGSLQALTVALGVRFPLGLLGYLGG